MYLYLTIHNYTSITPFLVKNENYEPLAYTIPVCAGAESNIISDVPKEI
jgi:hypothetical protein